MQLISSYLTKYIRAKTAQGCTILMLVFVSVFLSGGCGLYGPYTYEEIKSEYSDWNSPAPEAERDEVIRSPDYPLNLDDALAAATANNPELMQAVWRIEQSRAMLALADTAFWPRISFYTEYMQGDAPSSYLFKKIDQRMLPPNADFNEPGWFENFESGMKAQMNLFNGGRDYLSLQMAGIDLDVTRLSRAEIENNLKAEVIDAFYNVSAARDFVGIAEESVNTISEQLRIMTIRYEGGAVLKSDLLSLEVRLARAREQLVSARNRYRLAVVALSNLMGFDPPDRIEEEVVLAENEYSVPELPSTYEKGVEKALENRPELARVRRQLVNSRFNLASEKSAYLPSLDLMANYYLDDPNLDYDLDRENWTAAIVLNWDLFTGFSRAPRIARARAAIRELLAADRQALLGIRLDVRRAYLNMEEAESRYNVAKNSVESAEESFRLTKEHYQGGAVTVTRYLEAELDRNRARIQSTAAYYDRIRARAETARSLGIWAQNEL